MPKLLTFGICRQAIVDNETGSVSLINLINNLTINQQTDQTIQPDVRGSFEWGVVTAWLRVDEDEGKTFDQRQTVTTPDGETTDQAETNFTFDNNSESRILTSIAKVTGFPIGQAGIVTVTVDLRESGRESEWEMVAEYPVEVFHQLQEPPHL